jgi:PAS domain S-box-containing protein
MEHPMQIANIAEEKKDGAVAKGKILVVEDERIIAKDIENTLKGMGYVVPATASSGEESVKKALETEPDLVLMDIMLKGEMDGVEAAQKIRLHADIPVVFLTAYADDKTLERAKVTGPFGYLLKPFQERELLSTIEVALYKHRVEKELRESKRWFSTVLRSITDAVITSDRNGTLTFMNSAAEVLTGWREEDAVGRPLSEVFHLAPDGRGGTTDNPAMKMALEGTAVGLGNERTLTPKDGKEIRIDHGASPLRDGSGEIKGVILTFHDITERKFLETQLVQAQKLQAIGQLAAGIAHEINTSTQDVDDKIRFLKEAFGDIHQLLAKYDGLLKAARAGAPADGIVKEVLQTATEIDLPYLTEEVSRAIQRTLEGVDQVTKIVRAMKEFSHPGAFEKAPIDIHRAIGTTLTVARNEWKHVAEVVTDFDPALPPVPCLPGEFHQVILNVIINAAHAIAERVGDGPTPKGTITIRTRHHGNWAEIRIDHTGAGIPDPVKSRTFDPFSTTQKVGKGTGQGLAVAHSVIAGKHGGTMTFETVGKGTTFIIRLPVGDKAETP